MISSERLIFNDHKNLAGLHAPFTASSSSWLRYDDDQIIERHLNRYRTAIGTELHEYAAVQIELGQKASSVKNLVNNAATYIYAKYNTDNRKAYAMRLIEALRRLPSYVFESCKSYINDAIGYRMTPELVLYYSDFFYGTTDCISYRDRTLRISDMKTGEKDASLDQLEVYAALFCLEYRIDPADIDIELRIYQKGEVIYGKPKEEIIRPIMDKIVHSNKLLEKVNYGED